MSISIELSNITKTFHASSSAGGDVKALDNVSFSVEPGQIFGFVGANGAGKSTAMRIIMGILDADSGEVKLNNAKPNENIRKRIGYMPAERGLYAKMTVYDQLIYFASLRGLTSKAAKANANYWIERLGIDQYSKKPTASLSTGNMQKVQLATCMVSDPDTLILDEPFSGLDPIASASFKEILISLVRIKQKTVIFSSHQLELIDQISDKIGIISKGVMIGCGTPNQLRESAHQKFNSPMQVTIPTPLADIFGNIISANE